ncbi:carbon-nitrogen hydrolase family protein [Psychromonas ossibalaenae]|uniref:carbon-nitrogen hydrolase family protein n=1 Tax=Psychromonas ossibalaenae TaxID=444922 RepID=UPI00035DED44|nr:carbon-nitrogen hydrolase family protein [Psychromonas ossibalaenae]
MIISIVQTDVVYKGKSRNIDQAANLLADADADADIVGDMVILPELFSTGYIFDTAQEMHELCEQYTNSSTIEALRELAEQYDTLVVAGIAEKEADQFYNSVAVIDKNGLQYKYRKISQTNIDKRYFTRGDSLLTFQYHDLVFGIVICFDLWFPEIIRDYAEAGVNVLLHPANFGGEQSLHISKVRAIENSMYVVTCNRVGEDVTKDLIGKYCGCSQICSPTGEFLAQLNSEALLKTVEIKNVNSMPKRVIGVALSDEIQCIKNQLHHGD